MKNSNHINPTSSDSDLKIKVCGMGSEENIKEVASLQPDYIGFIFHEKSPRNFQTEIPEISSEIKKTGVFVDATLDYIVEKVKKYNFQAVQLHGKESPEFCRDLRNVQELSTVETIKVFSVMEEFNFDILKDYEGVVDYFLFDTKGKNKGGNGVLFNWELLKNYPSNTPFFLSGGIGVEEVEKIRELQFYFRNRGKLNILYAIDVNSRFETAPAVKDKNTLIEFKKKLLNLQEK